MLKVACIQLRSGTEVAANVAAASELIRQAAKAGAELIATPEMTSLLDKTPGALWAKAVDEAGDSALAAFRKLAKELKVWLLAGSLPMRAAESKCFNRSFLIGPDGEVSGRYDKIHMFDVQLNASNVYRESDSFASGGAAAVVETPKFKLGMTVCYDVRFPHLYRDLAKAGAQIIAVPSAFTRITGEAHWHILLRARAIETGAFILAPAQGGRHQDGRETYGHSLIIGPWGDILAEGGVEPGVIVADINLEDVDAARRKIPALTHDRAYRPAD